MKIVRQVSEVMYQVLRGAIFSGKIDNFRVAAQACHERLFLLLDQQVQVCMSTGDVELERTLFELSENAGDARMRVLDVVDRIVA